MLALNDAVKVNKHPSVQPFFGTPAKIGERSRKAILLNSKLPSLNGSLF